MDIMDRLKGPGAICLSEYKVLRDFVATAICMLTKQHLSTNLPQRAIRISLAVRVVLAKVCCFLHWKRISVERKSF